MQNKKLIYTFHLFFVAPLLAYIGWNEGKVNKKIFTLLLILVILMVPYHLKELMKVM